VAELSPSHQEAHESSSQYRLKPRLVADKRLTAALTSRGGGNAACRTSPGSRVGRRALATDASEMGAPVHRAVNRHDAYPNDWNRIRCSMSAAGETGDQTRVRFAIISDPHAVSGHAHRHDTHARWETAADPTLNPFAAVRQLIERSHEMGGAEPLTADALLCPGDLANRLNEGGLAYAWKELEDIAGLLGAQRILATAGNHDVLRPEKIPAGADDDAWVAALRKLTPAFPSAHAGEAERYFIDDFMVAEGERWRVIALNSCANHSEPGQAWHGKVEEKTLQHIKHKIAHCRKDVNVLMCHHHPVEWTHLGIQDTSHMQGGDRLLRCLGDDDPANWIVLHGHRHVPALGYAGDTSSGPVRLSAGSLAVCLQREGRGNVRNQFYMLEFDLEHTAALGLAGAGTLRAWDWDLEEGMIPASQSSELPGTGGFGFRRDARELARTCRSQAQAISQRSVTWEELLGEDGRWAYIAPRDLLMLRRALELEGALVEPLEGHANIERVSFASKA
jgi:hypothetical protein